MVSACSMYPIHKGKPARACQWQVNVKRDKAEGRDCSAGVSSSERLASDTSPLSSARCSISFLRHRSLKESDTKQGNDWWTRCTFSNHDRYSLIRNVAFYFLIFFRGFASLSLRKSKLVDGKHFTVLIFKQLQGNHRHATNVLQLLLKSLFFLFSHSVSGKKSGK